MNERIKELVMQAGGIRYDEDGDELTPILIGKDLAKFAELIVRECLQISDEFEIDVNQIGLVSRITRHFGVEE